MTIFPLPVIAEHSSSTVMEEYLRDIILSKVSSFPITAGDSGLVTGQGDDSEINLLNGLRIVQDNARVFRCPEVHSEMNEEEDDDSTKQQHKQQRKPTSNKCRWGSESPTKLSPITSRRNSVTNDGDKLPLSVRRKMLSRKGLRSPPPPSLMPSSLCRWTSTDLQDLTKEYLIPMAGEKVTVQAAVEKAISVSSSSKYSYSDPYQRSQRAGSSDKLMRRPERRVSVEGFEKLLCYQEEDQQGDEKLGQNVRWHSY